MNKITAQWIKDKIRKVECVRIPGSAVTICNVTLENGFSVRGESACVDPGDYHEELGKELAYKDAFNKIWALEGYLLAEGLWIQRECPEVQDFGWALRQLKAGKKVARKGWNGKDMWLSFSPGADRLLYTNFWSKANREWAKGQPDNSAQVLPCVTMKTVDSSGHEAILMGWLASQTDMLSEDWVVIE